MNDTEVCLNVWFIVDSGTGLIYRAAARAYALSGSDNEKARILKSLSVSDFQLSKHFSLSKYKTSVVEPDGTKHSADGFFADSLNSLLPDVIDMICKGLEADFIAQPKVTPAGVKFYKMKIPNNPYYVSTYIYENDQGIVSLKNPYH